jgi:hypothetical protein
MSAEPEPSLDEGEISTSHASYLLTSKKKRDDVINKYIELQYKRKKYKRCTQSSK